MTDRRVRWLALAVVAAACVPYVPSVRDYFTQDDFGVVQLLAGKPWSTFPRWFVMPWMEQIWGYTPDELRPFVAFTYQVTALPGAARPELHHLVNIAIHAGNAVLVMALARTGMGVSIAAAAVAGGMFALFPVHAESVAWITGRVDSMPAFLYFASVLAYVRWRQASAVSSGPGAYRWYGLSLGLFFAALFSKQNTITMVATLAAYDLISLDSSRRGSVVSCVRAWSPFAVMTLAFLALRRVVFGASMRGGIDSLDQVLAAGPMIGRHVMRTVFGHVGPVDWWEIAAVALVVGVICIGAVRRMRVARHALVFGVGWWVIGAAPVLLAGYESTRHVYLAAAGWAFLLALAYDAVQVLTARAAPVWRVAAVVLLAVPLAGAYAIRLGSDVNDWGARARVSRLAVELVAREAAQVPQGTLLFVSVPEKSWAWAAPFALEPPYAPAGALSRVELVTPFRLHCCGPEQWNVDARNRLRRWSEGEAPVVALHVTETGVVSRLTDRERPELRFLARILLQTDSWQTLDGAFVGLMEQVVRR